MNLVVIGSLVAKIVGIYAIVARLVEAILQWWNQSTNKNAILALWQIIYNFVTVELYKKPAAK